MPKSSPENKLIFLFKKCSIQGLKYTKLAQLFMYGEVVFIFENKNVKISIN